MSISQLIHRRSDSKKADAEPQRLPSNDFFSKMMMDSERVSLNTQEKNRRWLKHRPGNVKDALNALIFGDDEVRYRAGTELKNMAWDKKNISKAIPELIYRTAHDRKCRMVWPHAIMLAVDNEKSRRASLSALNDALGSENLKICAGAAILLDTLAKRGHDIRAARGGLERLYMHHDGQVHDLAKAALESMHAQEGTAMHAPYSAGDDTARFRRLIRFALLQTKGFLLK
jgi:hypothetical protein